MPRLVRLTATRVVETEERLKNAQNPLQVADRLGVLTEFSVGVADVPEGIGDL